MKLLILNGPNLNLLGRREPALYGERSYDDLVAYLNETCAEAGVACRVLQSNHEGDLVDWIQSAAGAFDGIVINAAAYSHTSVAILDALKAVALPAAEVHLTDVSAREEFRRSSYTALGCQKTFSGRGFESYRDAINYLKEQLA